jgi:hypothetical protein
LLVPTCTYLRGRFTHQSGIKTTFLLYSTLLNDIMAG